MQLYRTLLDRSVQPSPGLSRGNLKQILQIAKNLQSLFLGLENTLDSGRESAAVQTTLMEITREAHKLVSDTPLVVALQSCSDPNLRRSLPESLGKLGRYYSISLDLICAATRQKLPNL